MTYGNIFGHFHSILNIAIEKNNDQFVHTQNLFGQVTTKNHKKIWTLQSAIEELVKIIYVLAVSQPQLIQLTCYDQLSLLEDRI